MKLVSAMVRLLAGIVLLVYVVIKYRAFGEALAQGANTQLYHYSVSPPVLRVIFLGGALVGVALIVMGLRTLFKKPSL